MEQREVLTVHALSVLSCCVCLGVLSESFLVFYFLFVCLCFFLFFVFVFVVVVVFFSFKYYESKKSKNWRTIPNNVVN